MSINDIRVKSYPTDFSIFGNVGNQHDKYMEFVSDEEYYEYLRDISENSNSDS